MIKIKVGDTKYPAYINPNRQEWIDSIPKGWTQKRIAFNTKLLTGFAFKSEQFSFDDGVRLVRGDNVTEGKLRWGNKERLWPLMGPEFENLLLEAGDILIGMDGSKVGKNYAMVTNEDLPLLLVQRVARLRTDDELDPRFLYYCIGNKLFLYWITINKTDPMVPHITPKDITNYEIAFPSFKEQILIARFLDQKTNQIDALIRQKENLLKLLTEKRTAIITQAVTKGLDPDVKVKDSGIDWLGEIPKEWEVIPLKYQLKSLNKRRIPLSAEERGTMAKEFPYYGASGIIDYVDDYIFDEDLILIAEDGANLLSRSTPLAFVAKGKYWVNNHAHILKSDPMTFGFWSNLLCLIDYTPWITGAAQPKLTKENLGSIPLPKPPEDEQLSIAKYIENEVVKIDPLIDKVKSSIDQLKEYREALITAAVTGQIDVRKELE